MVHTINTIIQYKATSIDNTLRLLNIAPLMIIGKPFCNPVTAGINDE